MGDKLKIVEIRADAPQAPAEPAVVTAAETLPPDQVGPGRAVTLHFALHLENGQVVDSNFVQAPARFVFGDGNLLPAFEARLKGLRAGDRGDWLLPAEEAFGAVNEDNIQKYPRYQFPADLVLEEGLMVSFADSAGNEQAGIVTDTDKRNITIDFNHPLAGRSIRFSASILAVDEA